MYLEQFCLNCLRSLGKPENAMTSNKRCSDLSSTLAYNQYSSGTVDLDWALTHLCKVLCLKAKQMHNRSIPHNAMSLDSPEQALNSWRTQCPFPNGADTFAEA